jgi:hypothetical protein
MPILPKGWAAQVGCQTAIDMLYIIPFPGRRPGGAVEVRVVREARRDDPCNGGTCYDERRRAAG